MKTLDIVVLGEPELKKIDAINGPIDFSLVVEGLKPDLVDDLKRKHHNAYAVLKGKERFVAAIGKDDSWEYAKGGFERVIEKIAASLDSGGMLAVPLEDLINARLYFFSQDYKVSTYFSASHSTE